MPFGNNIRHRIPLESPVYGKAYTLMFPCLGTDGVLIAPSGNFHGYVSTNTGTFAQCINDPPTIIKDVGGAVDSAWAYITLEASEMLGVGNAFYATADNIVPTPILISPRAYIIDEQDTCQAGSGAGTIVLAADASDDSRHYKGYIVALESGAGAGQAALAQVYDGDTKILEILPNWQVLPGADTVYSLRATDMVPNIAASVTDISNSVTNVFETADGNIASVNGTPVTSVDDFKAEVSALATSTEISNLENLSQVQAQAAAAAALSAYGVFTSSEVTDLVTSIIEADLADYEATGKTGTRLADMITITRAVISGDLDILNDIATFKEVDGTNNAIQYDLTPADGPYLNRAKK